VLAGTPALASDGLRKGPWLMDPRPDALTVMIEREVAGPVHVRAWPLVPEGVPDGAPPALEVEDGAAVTLHEVTLRGLVPGSRYRYEVRGPGLAPTGGRFTTPPAGFAPFRFVIYGDTRSDESTHAAIVRAIRGEGAEFVVHTGDLIEDGRREAQWQTFFEIERDLLRDVPFVPVIGNHEIIRRGTTGIDNFRRYVHCEPASPRPELDYTLAYGSVRLVVANAYDDWTLPEMRDWLAGQLSQARREVPEGFVIVAMHWGLCSCGPHGENRMMRAAGIDELFRRHGVDLLLSGHDHLYERGEDHGLRYVVTGGGGAPVYRVTRPREYALVTASEHHYVRADVDRDGIVLTAVRPDGSVLDRCTLRRTGWDCPRSVPAAVVSAGATPGAPAGSSAVSGRSCGCRAAGHARGGLRALAAALVALAARRRARLR
jgi:predicted phosphodiesterase